MSGGGYRSWFEPRVASVVLVLVGAAVLVPYLVSGPGHFLDDWFALRNARLDGWWEAAGSSQWRARPGAGVVYALTFGLIGAQPLIHAALAAVVLVATAVVLERVLRRLLPAPVALAIGAAWLVVPNHTSLEAWPSTLNIALALLLLVGAAERLTATPATLSKDAQSALLLGGSVLCYEATVVVGMLAVLVVASYRRAGRSRWRLLLGHAAVLLPVGAWMLVNWHPGKSDIDVWIDPTEVVTGHVGVGVVGENVGAAIVGALVLVTTVIAVYLHRTRPVDGAPSWPVHLLVAGWIVVALGAVPFLRYFYSPVGLGDRVTVVSGLGGAAVLVGVVGWIGSRRAAIGGLLAVGLLVGALANRGSLVRDYSVAADDSRRILDTIERRWPSGPDEQIVFGPYPVMKRNIVAFMDAHWPVQWLYGSRSVSAGFTLTDDAFESIPPERRVNIVELSDLEPVDRVVP